MAIESVELFLQLVVLHQVLSSAYITKGLGGFSYFPVGKRALGLLPLISMHIYQGPNVSLMDQL